MDIKDGRCVKGINFVDLRDAGDPVALGRAYSEQGIDELVFLDISATIEQRKTTAALASKIAATINIPFTIGGGISKLADVEILLQSGADKIAINSAALNRPELIDELALSFGSQCITVAIDARQENEEWKVYRSGGRVATTKELFNWAEECAERGAGEILFTSMDHDGTKQGFANETLAELADRLPIPLIASGGAGSMEHFAAAFEQGKASAALAASVFHFGEIGIVELKKYLLERQVEVRC